MPVNLRQLAEKLELSTTTVSRALAGYSDVSSDTRHRVREAAKKHNYHPNPVAQRLQKGKTETIGIVLSPGQNYFKDTFFLDLLSGISVSLGKIGFDLTISVAPDSQHEIDSLHRMVQGKRVDGIILTLTKAQDERISYLLDKNFPFILYGRTEDPRPHAFLDMDGELAFRESCKYLIDLGHKRIALINGEPEYMFPAFCFDGYKNGLKYGGIAFDPDLVREWRHGDAELSSLQQTLELMQHTDPPSAIIFQTEAATGILQALQQLQLTVGKDVSLIGYDDLEIAKTNIPPLTTMRPQASNAGERLVGMLMEIIGGCAPDTMQKIWQTELVHRQSTCRFNRS
ncbi:MAG: HTH-type transcriptional regulator RafR [Deltaproteobacteria bacterium]|jgi:LacI family transcriptional regulator|nr:HTH-type transcriptional regulator RafR [Deltaproteobacteria bacterium]